MKIFALATAVSASSFKRTEFPAPGVINTQGGYWADGQYNPPDGQAPQVSFQTQQCCKNLRWYPYKTDPGLEIWLHYEGEHRQMPYYKGEKDGETVYAWMNYMGPDDYWFGNVKTAHWIISKELGEYGDSTTDNELISDFSGLGFEKTGFISRPKCIEQATQWQNTFVCGNPQWGTGNLGEEPEQYGVPSEPPVARTCESANSKTQMGNGIFHGVYGEGKINTCRFSQLMEQLGKPQMRRAVYFIEPKKSNYAENSFSDIIAEWGHLAGESYKKLDCGWNALQGFTKRLTKRHYRDPVRCMTPNKPEKCAFGSGFIDRCEWMCPMMSNIGDFGKDTMEENSAYVAEETLNLVLWLADEYFIRYHLEESDDEVKTIRGCRPDPDNGWKMVNNDGNPCEQTDKCGQHVRSLHRKVAEFQTLLGEGSIDRLTKYNQDWRGDLDQ